MALPVPPNTTCDIYRVGNTPPAAPDVAGSPCVLIPAYEKGLEMGESVNSQFRFTHMLLIDKTVDIRDHFSIFGGTGGNRDIVYIPNKNGIPYNVNFVERINRGSSLDMKRVYLDRQPVPWPWPVAGVLGNAGGVNAGGQASASAVNLVAWYKADAIVGLVDNDSVSTWLDSSGHGNTALQATGGNQPIYKTNQINGLPVVRFDGADDYLSIASNFDFNRLTAIVVASRTGIGAATNNSGVFGGAQQLSWGFFAKAVAGGSYSQDNWGIVHHWGASFDTASSLWTTAEGFVCVAVRYDGVQVDHWKNGIADGTTTGTFTPTFSGGAPYEIGWIDRIGNGGSTSEIFQGDVAEILLFNGPVGDSQLASIFATLLTKYDL